MARKIQSKPDRKLTRAERKTGSKLDEPADEALGYIVEKTNGIVTKRTRTSRDPETGRSDPRLFFKMLSAGLSRMCKTTPLERLLGRLSEWEEMLRMLLQESPNPRDPLQFETASEALNRLENVRRDMQFLIDDLTGIPHAGRISEPLANRVMRIVFNSIDLGASYVESMLCHGCVDPVQKWKENSDTRETILAGRQRIANHNRQVIRDLWQDAKKWPRPPVQKKFAREIAELTKTKKGRRKLGLLGDKSLSQSTIEGYLKRGKRR